MRRSRNPFGIDHPSVSQHGTINLMASSNTSQETLLRWLTTVAMAAVVYAGCIGIVSFFDWYYANPDDYKPRYFGYKSETWDEREQRWTLERARKTTDWNDERSIEAYEQLSQAIDQVRESRRKVNLREWEAAYERYREVYRQQHGEYPPPEHDSYYPTELRAKYAGRS